MGSYKTTRGGKKTEWRKSGGANRPHFLSWRPEIVVNSKPIEFSFVLFCRTFMSLTSANLLPLRVLTSLRNSVGHEACSFSKCTPRAAAAADDNML